MSLLLLFKSSGTTITGSSSASQAAQTSTASGLETITGSSTASQAAQTSTASGSETIPGSAAITQSNQTSTTTGTLTITGTAAITQADQTATTSGIGGIIVDTPHPHAPRRRSYKPAPPPAEPKYPFRIDGYAHALQEPDLSTAYYATVEHPDEVDLEALLELALI